MLPLFIYCGVGAGRADCIGTDTAVVLSKLSEGNKADLTFWLFFIAVFIFDFEFYVRKEGLGTVRVWALRLAAFDPSTEAAIRKESVMKELARSTFDFRGD